MFYTVLVSLHSSQEKAQGMSEIDSSNEVYNFIQRFIAEHGFSPTLREIAKACFMSTTTVVRYLDRLCAAGRISRELNKPRSIALLDLQHDR